jgi:hypothetical protein
MGADTPLPKMVGAEDRSVNHRWECSVWIQVSAADAWNINELQHRPIARKEHQADADEEDGAIALPAFSDGKIQKTAECVADCNVLQDAGKPKRLPYILRKSIDSQTEQKERNASTGGRPRKAGYLDVYFHGRCGCASRGIQE